MPVRRKKRAAPPKQFRPPMPAKLRNYFPGDWGRPVVGGCRLGMGGCASGGLSTLAAGRR